MKSKLRFPELDVERIDVTLGYALDVDTDNAGEQVDHIDGYGHVIQLRTQLGVFTFFAPDWVVGEFVARKTDLTEFIEAAKRRRELLAAMRPPRDPPR